MNIRGRIDAKRTVLLNYRISITVHQVVRALCRKLLPELNSARFDPVYYVRRYPDLAALSTAEAVRRHFHQHGRKEGRFPNALAEAEALYRIYLNPSEEFDLRAYKALNPDLRVHFHTDREYILHYIRHGKAEGRACTFDVLDLSDGGTMPSWSPRLSVSQFSAWASDRLEQPSRSRRGAVALFEAQGIDRLAPLRFDLTFDPGFYRHHYAPGTKLDDVALYRRWLHGGESRNEAPNEGTYLMPFIGEAPFLTSFDYRGYVAAAGLPTGTDRAFALKRLFESERDVQRVRKFAANDFELIESLVRYRFNRHRTKEADTLLAAWRDEAEVWPPSLWVLRGDIDARLGRREPARDAMVQAVTSGDRTFHPVSQIARLDLTLGAPERAAAWLREQRSKWTGSAQFEQLAEECIDRWFEKLSAVGHRLLSGTEDQSPDAEQVTEFNNQMSSSLAAITEAIEALEPAPAEFGSVPDGHVALLANEDLRQCTHYRVEQKQEQFAQAGIELRRHSSNQIAHFVADLPGARAAIFYRVAATPDVIRAILTARRMGMPTYYEIDDLLFESASYPAPYQTYQAHLSPTDYNGLRFGVPLFRFALSLCDNAIASTPALLEHMAPLTRKGRGLVVRNGLDSRNDAVVEAARRLDLGRRERVRIFYGSGTLAHNADFVELTVPALSRLMAERNNVDLVLVGNVVFPEAFSQYEHRILRMPAITDIADYWAILSRCDINIAPLHPDPAADCKSEIKWLEAAALRVPSVVSGTATYRDVISQGTDGLIAEDSESWYESLIALIGDADLRKRIGEAAQTKALTRYSLEVGASVWRREFAHATSALAPAQSKRLRVLVCNVFFAPQSLGGATRVVEDNVAWIAANCPNIELAVFCTDDGANEPGRLRTSGFGNVPVFRLSVTAGRDSDTRIFNDDNSAGFRKAVEVFRPDIVHFHCIQRLTASIVQATRDMGIPYIVTLHDAWWLSPHQFLVDRDGILHMPDADPLADFAEHRSTSLATIVRRRALDPLLLGAERIITVSERFAEVYRSAGIAPVTVIANGVPDLPPAVPRSPAAGPLRLAHIGGRASHKGADLVEAALRLGNYPNFHLLMIDGHVPPGKRIETRWGETSVTISAPVAQADIASLYAEMDVLLAPSRWPESFGLVAREALHFGVWVVASRLGAMGDDVVEGQNGFLIDTATRKDLDQALTRLHAEPHRFRQGMASPVGRLRTSAEQADELAGLYREIGGRLGVQ